MSFRRPAALLLAALLVAAGCSNSVSEQKQVKPLKVAVVDELTFKREYRDYFDLLYPDVPIEIVSTSDVFDTKDPVAAYVQVVKRERPDIIILSQLPFYQKLADEGLIDDLTAWMSRSDMTESDYQPGVVRMLKENSNKKIYGLSPQYDTALLYYNADLFRKYGIETPKNGLTWRELFQLAYRFEEAGSAKEGVVGYHDPWMHTINDLVFTTLNGTEGLQLVDWKKKQFLIDSTAWQGLLQTAVEAVRNRSITIKGVEVTEVGGVRRIEKGAIEKQDMFAKGKAAMTVDMYGNKYRYNQAKFAWSAVLPPVNASTRESGGFMRLDSIFCISSSSEQKEEAWKMVRFIGSERVAKIVSKVDGRLSPLKSSVELSSDPLASVAFEQKPTLTPSDWTNRGDFYKEENAMIQSELLDVLGGKQSLDTAIQTMQKKGQLLVERYAESGQ
jgi:multiple sugar transport system substrate-binding protein